MNEALLHVVGLSLVVTGTAVALAAMIGIPAGVLLALARFPGKRVVEVVIYTGMALPPVVVGLIVYLLLSRSGPLGAWGWLFTPQAMIVAQTLLAIPLITGICANAVEAVPHRLVEQVRSLGASHWQLRWTVLREARQGLILAVLAAFGRGLSEVGAVLMVGGNIEGQTRVLTTAIVLETSKGEFRLALLLGLVLLLLALVINGAVLWLRGGRTWT